MHGGVGGTAHFDVQLLPIMYPRTPQAKFSERLAQRAAEIFHRPRRGSWVQWIAPGDQAEQAGRSRDAARERADMIKRRRERHGPEDADAPESRLQPDGPAKSGRDTNRAACVGTNGSRAQARGNRGGGASARSAGNPIERPGIVHRAVVGVAACDSVGEFVQVGFPDQDGSGTGKFARDGGIFRGDEIVQDFRSRGRADAARPNVVLERDRYPEEWEIFALRAATVEQMLFRA